MFNDSDDFDGEYDLPKIARRLKTIESLKGPRPIKDYDNLEPISSVRFEGGYSVSPDAGDVTHVFWDHDEEDRPAIAPYGRKNMKKKEPKLKPFRDLMEKRLTSTEIKEIEAEAKKEAEELRKKNG